MFRVCGLLVGLNLLGVIACGSGESDSGPPAPLCREDNCGVCDHDPENDCEQDCSGRWGGEARIDCAEVCAGSAFLDEDGACCTEEERDCLGDCGGSVVVDCNGECGGGAIAWQTPSSNFFATGAFCPRCLMKFVAKPANSIASI